MKRFVVASLLGLALLFGTCIALVDWTTVAPTASGPSLAEEWLEETVLPAGVTSLSYFGSVLTEPGVSGEYVATARSNFRRHLVTFPDGSEIETGWNVEGQGLSLEYIVALP